MANFGVEFYFIFSTILVIISLLGLMLSKKNYFLLIISVEIFFMAINLNFLIASLYLDDMGGIIFVIFLLAVSGGEVAVGLALFILIYKKFGSFTTYNIINIKG